jgi:cellobiose-specific phosphotransferase system component IIC
MNTSLMPAIIAGALAIVAVILTNHFTRKRDRDADWRKIKLEYYNEFMSALAGNVIGRATSEDVTRFHDALHTIGLVASAHVILALKAFQAEISIENKNRDPVRHDPLLTVLVRAMRADNSPRGSKGDEAWEFRLIAPPPGETAPTSPNSRTST